ncbi:DUF4139 domain-containing protein [Paracoccus caeni]|uniref:DUF4139 domain-containing protein n=1 Tax=Paracoccus caeni TaxID=657651 RepID=A0A934SM32_9RHOB|nr:DUF4139 domain-containing protein [Paracoccus caeni]MBK4217717.1 DUF4139 domain-containing protein [Paracoccus caeni]
MTLRPVFPALFLGLVATPALSDRIEAELIADRVTVYPSGASISWRVDLPGGAGAHEVIVPGLPQGMADGLRIEAQGAVIGTVNAASDDPAAEGAVEAATVQAARARRDAEHDALRALEAQLYAKQAEARSWQERAQMVRDLMRGDARIAAADLAASVEEAGGMIATYLERETQANAEAAQLLNRQAQLARNVQLAEADLNRIIDRNAALETLTMTVQTTDQPAQITLTGFTSDAWWNPVYDLALDRATGQITMDRALMVRQNSGVDWDGVTLTLSTAQPNGQSAPSQVNSVFPSLEDPALKSVSRNYEVAEMAAPAGAGMAPVADEAARVVENAQLASIGMTVAYDYPTPVDVKNGGDALRLTLDQKTLESNVFAEAAPRFDQTAFVVAEGQNSLGEPILPGRATLRLDGALIGQTDLPLIATGDDVRVGFGPIIGMTAELRVPEDSTGDRGFLSRSTQQQQTHILIVRNLTGEEWPLRVVDRVPVSRDEELTINFNAEPAPTETDPDGRRGVLYWEAALPAGETREITVTSDLRWPEGKSLDMSSQYLR